ncbi:MAG: GNAT family N-acetyltransferase [Lachnospiraceae bacterium]|nr:GNAT family N-acetyltransferase [Lachnospiraceae bacterium]MDY4068447.1 GNAT family N-acetyltransferase [Lachnospiraceae bacterium]
MITYSRVEEKDLEQIIALYQTHLNSGQYIADEMMGEFKKKDYLGFTAKDDDELVGFFMGQDDIAFTYPHPELEDEIRQFAGGRKLYTPDGLLVLEAYRGKGVAGELIRQMKRALLEREIELALVELWIYPDGSVPAQKPLRGLGEAVYQNTVAGFYSGAMQYGIKCPICGENCTCGALIELLEIKE